MRCLANSTISCLETNHKTSGTVFQAYNYRIHVHLLNNSILFSYEQNFFLDKLAFDCDILRNFAIGGLSPNKRRTTKNIYV